jgi:Bifunctional DNA primase/polymerase, N-terminal
MSPMTPMDHAIQLALDGFATFPCNRSKAPTSSHGFQDATTDAAAIGALWQRYRGEPVGVATGPVSDLAVLDIDAKHGEAHEWWTAHRNQLPPTRTIRTRSGGLHLWFRNAPGLRCSASAIAHGVDVRAAGGYVIAWQTDGQPVLRDVALAPWPAWLQTPDITPIQRGTEPPRVPDDRQMAALVRIVATAPESQRNKQLFWAACRVGGMVTSRLLGKSEAEALLVHAAMHAGLPEIEATRTARSGLTTGGNG